MQVKLEDASVVLASNLGVEAEAGYLNESNFVSEADKDYFTGIKL